MGGGRIEVDRSRSPAAAAGGASESEKREVESRDDDGSDTPKYGRRDEMIKFSPYSGQSVRTSISGVFWSLNKSKH